MINDAPSYVRSVCQRSHEGLPTDTGYTLPDDVWAITAEEREARAKWTTDLCQFGERYFIRGVLFIPFTERSGAYGWGVWVEVKSPDFKHCVALYDKDGSQEPKVSGLLANRVPLHEESLGLPVLVQIGSSTQRPTITFPPEASHPFAVEQKEGIDETRFHAILVASGAIEAIGL
jgi:hypothetical protein